MKENFVLRKLREGKFTLGSWICLNSPLIANVMAEAGFDWLTIDTEHGVMDYREMVEMVHAILSTHAAPIVRVAWNDPALIKRALDAGAMGIIVPMVMSAEEAKKSVEAVRFPPKGKRSVVGVAAEILHGSDYIELANEQILLAVQIEHIDAVARTDEICSVEGLDVVFVGPYDLAASMGLLGTKFKQDPDWKKAVQKVLDSARKANKAAGIHAQTVEEAISYIRQGFQFVALGSDIQFLRLAVNLTLPELNKQLSTQL
ncbi:MAG: aldolase/citrate lyase family protein [Armatimonadetes bacterium]|nr:aldolase/citrate lyase family protein [Armatimonadota bacterium]